MSIQHLAGVKFFCDTIWIAEHYSKGFTREIVRSPTWKASI